MLEEIDTTLGKVVQTLRLPDVGDVHDAVRVGNSVFIADTANGDVVEIDLPTSVPMTDNFPIPDEEPLVEEPQFHNGHPV